MSTPVTLPKGTRVEQVRLRTRDLKKALGFYQRMLGLKIVGSEGTTAELSGDGSKPAAIVLTEDSAASPWSPRSTGLFHLAIRYPNRSVLARTCRTLLKKDYPLEGASDHLVSEAIYLGDPEGNGVELYADRPRSEWSWEDGQVKMATYPLNLEGLLSAASDKTLNGDAGPELGHVHLRVAELEPAERFYHEFLGLDITQRSYPGALFFSAGGYHHHIATNTWGSPRPAEPNSAGLISYRMNVPQAEAVAALQKRAVEMGYAAEFAGQPKREELLRVRDPNGNWLELT